LSKLWLEVTSEIFRKELDVHYVCKTFPYVEQKQKKSTSALSGGLRVQEA